MERSKHRLVFPEGLTTCPAYCRDKVEMVYYPDLGWRLVYYLSDMEYKVKETDDICPISFKRGILEEYNGPYDAPQIIYDLKLVQVIVDDMVISFQAKYGRLFDKNKSLELARIFVNSLKTK